uniref:Uncharacterized protein n=1 Tax=Anguilla anguilla TaxID=7936 RepID=A0A0E9V3L4_ANGAN
MHTGYCIIWVFSENFKPQTISHSFHYKEIRYLHKPLLHISDIFKELCPN